MKGRHIMFEKVNPSHPDKLCDRIAGAIVDLAYAEVFDPRIAVEVLLGHGICHIIVETDISIPLYEIEAAVERIAGKVAVDYVEVPQDSHLAKNQEQGFRCGDNGIFKGEPVTGEQQKLAKIAREIYGKYGCDGKYILDDDRLIICQSNASKEELRADYPKAEINPLGDWTGGTDPRHFGALLRHHRQSERELLRVQFERQQRHRVWAQQPAEAL